jgi:hypothetical protein
VAQRLAGVQAPWYVAAGWALDLFRGEQTREHEDLEIAVPARRFAEIRDALPGFEFDAVGNGKAWRLPSPALDLVHQTWVWDPAAATYRLDVFREPHDGDVWICRRDESIRLPYSAVTAYTPDGIPYLAPQIALLFKAKWTRPKDQADFDGSAPRLDAAQRAWLQAALVRIHPGHSWIGALEG